MKDLKRLGFTSENGCFLSGDKAIKFSLLKGSEEEKTAIFTAMLSSDLEDEIVFEYSVIGLYRGKAYRTPLVYLTGEDGKIAPIIANDDCNTDGRRYTVSARAPKGKYTSVSVQLSVERAKLCELSVYSFYTCKTEELPVSLSSFEEEKKEGISSVDISANLNGRFDPAEYNTLCHRSPASPPPAAFRFWYGNNTVFRLFPSSRKPEYLFHLCNIPD